MSSASYPIVTGSKKGIQLDPRTKLLLLLTITTLMFSTSNEGIMNLVKPLLSLVRNSINGMPVISAQSAPRTGRKIGTNPMGIATQQPMTKYSTVNSPRLIKSFA